MQTPEPTKNGRSVTDSRKSGFLLDKQAVTITACVSIVVACLGLNQFLNWRFDAQETKMAEAITKMVSERAEQLKALKEEAQAQNTAILAELKNLNAKLAPIEDQTSYRWSSLDMKAWAIEFREMNPSCTMPPIEAHP